MNQLQTNDGSANGLHVRLFSIRGVQEFKQAHFLLGQESPFTPLYIFLSEICIHHPVKVSDIVTNMLKYSPDDTVFYRYGSLYR